jgi:hypothetical protein
VRRGVGGVLAGASEPTASRDEDQDAVTAAQHGLDVDGQALPPLADALEDPTDLVASGEASAAREDAFIAAYLVGVRDFSTADLRVTAARIMGIESDHRTLARVVGPGVAAQDGGPIEKITGIQGHAESVDPPNNNGYERTLHWRRINQALKALTPFAVKSAAKKAGFDTTKPYKFHPFKPKLPTELGAFNSFLG